jgi:hypothetical protein
MGVADGFTRALMRQGIPIYGVSFYSEDDRQTWRIDYKPQATAAQRAAAEALKLLYDPATDTAYADEQADIRLSEPALRALAKATHELKTNTWTFAEFRDRIKAIFRSL